MNMNSNFNEIVVQLNLTSVTKLMWHMNVAYDFIDNVQERKSANVRRENQWEQNRKTSSGGYVLDFLILERRKK